MGGLIFAVASTLGGYILIDIITWLVSALIGTILAFVQVCITFFSSLNVFFEYLPFLQDITNALRAVAISILAIVSGFQILKSMFSYLGFESDEPWKIAARTIFFGFTIYYSYDICMYINSSFLEIVSMISNMDPSGFASAIKQFGGLNISSLIDRISEDGGLAMLQLLLYLFMLVKLVGIVFRLAYRTVLLMLLTFVSPIAFISGIGKSTKGILQGWVKVYSGSLIVQLMQSCLIIVIISVQNSSGEIFKNVVANNSTVAGSLIILNPLFFPLSVFLFKFLIILGACDISEKLEGLVKEVGLAVGFNSGPLMGPLDMIDTLSGMNNQLAMLTGGGDYNPGQMK